MHTRKRKKKGISEEQIKACQGRDNMKPYCRRAVPRPGSSVQLENSEEMSLQREAKSLRKQEERKGVQGRKKYLKEQVRRGQSIRGFSRTFSCSWLLLVETVSWSFESIGEEIRDQVIFIRKRCSITSQLWEQTQFSFQAAERGEKKKYISSASKSMLFVEKVFRILFELLPHHDFEEKKREIS